MASPHPSLPLPDPPRSIPFLVFPAPACTNRHQRPPAAGCARSLSPPHPPESYASPTASSVPSPLVSRLPVPLSLSRSLLPLSLRGRCAQPAQLRVDQRSEWLRLRSPRRPSMAMAGGGAAAAAPKRCMNPVCGAQPASLVVGDWKKGWPLRSGGFALLCDKCGYVRPSSSSSSLSALLVLCAAALLLLRMGRAPGLDG